MHLTFCLNGAGVDTAYYLCTIQLEFNLVLITKVDGKWVRPGYLLPFFSFPIEYSEEQEKKIVYWFLSVLLLSFNQLMVSFFVFSLRKTPFSPSCASVEDAISNTSYPNTMYSIEETQLPAFFLYVTLEDFQLKRGFSP